MHLPAPKLHYAKDIVFTGDTPSFATEKNPIVFVMNSLLDEKETNDECALENILLSCPNCERKTKELPACGKCFATLILGEEGE